MKKILIYLFLLPFLFVSFDGIVYGGLHIYEENDYWKPLVNRDALEAIDLHREALADLLSQSAKNIRCGKMKQPVYSLLQQLNLKKDTSKHIALAFDTMFRYEFNKEFDSGKKDLISGLAENVAEQIYQEMKNHTFVISHVKTTVTENEQFKEVLKYICNHYSNYIYNTMTASNSRGWKARNELAHTLKKGLLEDKEMKQEEYLTQKERAEEEHSDKRVILSISKKAKKEAIDVITTAISNRFFDDFEDGLADPKGYLQELKNLKSASLQSAIDTLVENLRNGNINYFTKCKVYDRSKRFADESNWCMEDCATSCNHCMGTNGRRLGNIIYNCFEWCGCY